MIMVLFFFGATIRRKFLTNLYMDFNENVWSVKREDLELISEVGKGSYAVVHKAKYEGKIVAVKAFKVDDVHEFVFEDFIGEVTAMADLRHPNLVMFIGAVFDEESPWIIQEFLSNGCLHDLLLDTGLIMSWKRRYKILRDCAFGMAHLHGTSFLHHDLKSLNVLLDEHLKAKVGDFGLASFTKSSRRAMHAVGTFRDRRMTRASSLYRNSTVAGSGRGANFSVISGSSRESQSLHSSAASARPKLSAGTPFWTAPEVLAGSRFTKESDVYSFGIVIAEVATRETPYRGENSTSVPIRVVTERLRPRLPVSTPMELQRLARKCWNQKAERRPNFIHIVNVLSELLEGVEKEEEDSRKRSSKKGKKKGVRRGSSFGLYERSSLSDPLVQRSAAVQVGRGGDEREAIRDVCIQ